MAELLAIDPGLSYLGWARFTRLKPGEIHPDRIAAAYLGSARIRVRDLYPPAWPIERRLLRLVESVQGMVRLYDAVELVVIEKPPYAGSYHDRVKRQKTKQGLNARDLQLLNFAIGALVIGVAGTGVAVRLAPASSKPKLTRLHIVRGYWKQFRDLDQPNDESDAVYLGLDAATSAGEEERGVNPHPG